MSKRFPIDLVPNLPGAERFFEVFNIAQGHKVQLTTRGKPSIVLQPLPAAGAVSPAAPDAI